MALLKRINILRMRSCSYIECVKQFLCIPFFVLFVLFILSHPLLLPCLPLLPFAHWVIDHRETSCADKSGSLLAASISLLKLEASDALCLETSPHSEVVEDDRTGYGYIQTCNFFCVLLDIDEVVADCYLVLV